MKKTFATLFALVILAFFSAPLHGQTKDKEKDPVKPIKHKKEVYILASCDYGKGTIHPRPIPNRYIRGWVDNCRKVGGTPRFYGVWTKAKHHDVGK